jgi:hypothetical protein
MLTLLSIQTLDFIVAKVELEIPRGLRDDSIAQRFRSTSSV